MTRLKSLLAATTVASLMTGCLVKEQAAPSEIAQAIPTSDQVAINLPETTAAVSKRGIGSSKELGQLADYYVLTRGVTDTFNGGSAWVLILIHTIVQFPVTSVSGDTYTWGPWTGSALDPAIYRLEVTANSDGSYDYAFDGHAKSDTTDTFLPLIAGHANPTPAAGQGSGTFLLDFDNARTVDPIDNANDKGQVDAAYDLAAMTLGLTIMSTDANGNPTSAEYAYEQTASGGGAMTFSVQASLDGNPAQEDVAVRSRWLSTGAGRSDALVTGGDLGSAEAIASECWDTSFDEVYYTDNVNYQPTEGDASQCAFSNVDLPPAT
jgi:hypothetical protein